MYAPALVAWTGGTGGNVGWFPLGPREVYAPPYRVSAAYLHGVNVSNTTIANPSYITSVYENQVTSVHYLNSASTAVTAVPQSVFTSAQRVSGHTVSLATAATAAAAAAPAIAPLRQSVLGAPAGSRRISQPPAAVAGRRVVTRALPPRAPASFETQLAAIRANGGHPLAQQELTRLQSTSAAPAIRMAPAAGKFAPAARAGGQAQAGPSLADRARALRNSALPPSPGGGTFSVYTPSQRPAPSAASEESEDRPVSVPQRAFAHDDPTHASGHPSAAQSYQAQTPVELKPGPARASASPARTVERPQYRAPEPSRPSSQAQSPGRQASREDAGAHADRSRDRLQR